MLMRVGMIAMLVLIGREFDWHQMQVAMPDPATSDELIRERPDLLEWPFQNARLQTVIVVQVNVECGHGQIVVGVLGFGELVAEATAMMVVDVAQDAYAAALGVIVGPFSGQKTPQQIADGFGSAGIAQTVAVGLKRLGQFRIQ
jgi:hypothetical protein